MSLLCSKDPALRSCSLPAQDLVSVSLSHATGTLVCFQEHADSVTY